MGKVTRLAYSGLALLLCLSFVHAQAPKGTSPAKAAPKAADDPVQLHHSDVPPVSGPSSRLPNMEVSTPVTPKANLSAPAQVPVNTNTILDFAGTVSAIEPDFDVVKAPDRSKVSIIKLYDKNKVLIYGMITPDKAGLYQIALVASGQDGVDDGETIRSYAFADINVVDSTSPPPDPVTPPGPLPTPTPTPPPGPLPNPNPTPPPGPTVPDTYGMYSFSKGVLAKMPTTEVWQPYAITIADVFDKMVAQKSGFTSATKFVEATSTAYKAALGENYSYWQYYFFNDIKAQLGKINTAGKLPSTVDAHAVAWQEISQALKEVKQPVAASKKASRK